MQKRKKEQTVQTHRRCLYCGVLLPAEKIDQHLDEHLDKWRNAPREDTCEALQLRACGDSDEGLS